MQAVSPAWVLGHGSHGWPWLIPSSELNTEGFNLSMTHWSPHPQTTQHLTPGASPLHTAPGPQEDTLLLPLLLGPPSPLLQVWGNPRAQGRGLTEHASLHTTLICPTH